MSNVKMYTAETITKKAISDFIRGERNKRDQLQSIIVACVQHAEQNSNGFDLLSQRIVGLKEVRSRNLSAITSYITEHVRGIEWVKTKKFTGYKKKKGEKVTYLPFKRTWFESNLNDQQIVAFNAETRLKTFANGLLKAIEGKQKLEGMTKEQAQKLLNALNPFYNPTPITGDDDAAIKV